MRGIFLLSNNRLRHYYVDKDTILPKIDFVIHIILILHFKLSQRAFFSMCYNDKKKMLSAEIIVASFSKLFVSGKGNKQEPCSNATVCGYFERKYALTCKSILHGSSSM